MDTFDIADAISFVVTYKWWIAVAVPFAIAVLVLRARG